MKIFFYYLRERLRLPESDQGGVASDLKATLGAALEGGEGSDDLRTRLNQVEQLCQDVMEENEVLKEEIEEMQREIEEMHDHFQVNSRSLWILKRGCFLASEAQLHNT